MSLDPARMRRYLLRGQPQAILTVPGHLTETQAAQIRAHYAYWARNDARPNPVLLRVEERRPLLTRLLHHLRHHP